MPGTDGESAAPRRLALVIGNSKYTRSENRLPHATQNASDITTKLTSLDFKVETKSDIPQGLLEQITEFAKTIQKDDWVVFYFSGHCRQANNDNYLVPGDDKGIVSDKELGLIACSAKKALDKLTANGPQVTIFILDCYKPYLYQKEPVTSTAGQGLSQMIPPKGTFIQFACAANQVVNDASTTDRDNLFAKCLLEHLAEPNVTIGDVFQQIVKDVSGKSGGRQTPLSMNNLGQHGKIYLKEIKNEEPTDEDIINEYNKYIRDLQVELEELTLLGPLSDGGSYNKKAGYKIGRIRALIHSLELERNAIIKQRFRKARAQ